MTTLKIPNRFQKNLEEEKRKLIDRALETQNQEEFMKLTKQGDEWISYVLEKTPHLKMLLTFEVEDVIPVFDTKRFNLYLSLHNEGDEIEFPTLEEYAKKTLLSDDAEEIKEKIQQVLESIPPKNEIVPLLQAIIDTPELLQKTILVTENKFRGFGMEISPHSFGLTIQDGYQPADDFLEHPSDDTFSVKKLIEFLDEKVTVIPISLNRKPRINDIFKDLFN